jgi:hypothetical protein
VPCASVSADDRVTPGLDPQSQLLVLLNGYLTTQALHAAAVLGIADLLADRSLMVDELAAATGAHAPSLYRLLRMLTGTRVFREEAEGLFALGDLGHALRSDNPRSVRDWALYIGAPAPWAAWGRLRETVLSGESGFVLEHGMGTYEYMAAHPELAGPFDRWMTHQSEQHNAAVVAGFDFSPFHVVADIGGGQGSTLAAILQANPHLRGILMDVPTVVADTTPLSSAGVADRCDVVAGDMLAGVPAGADLYLMKRVLMIWGDDDAVTLLEHCARALPENGRLLAVELVMPTDNDPSPAKSFDLLMLLAHPGGRIRTECEYRDIFAAAGLQLLRVTATPSPNSLLEASRL